MTKYKVVCEKIGGWCVIVTGKSGEDRFWGFRDEAHAREWIVKKTTKEALSWRLLGDADVSSPRAKCQSEGGGPKPALVT
jgi:hypothetical protein